VAPAALSTENHLAKPDVHATTHTDIDLDDDRDLGHDLNPDFDLDFGDDLDPEFDLASDFDLGPAFDLDPDFDLGNLILRIKDL